MKHVLILFFLVLIANVAFTDSKNKVCETGDQQKINGRIIYTCR